MPLYQETEPQIVSRLADTLKAIRSVVGTGMTAANIADPIMVLIGYPTWTEATKVLAQPIDPGYVTIDALPDVRITTRYAPMWGQVGPLVTAFSATETTDSVSFTQLINPSPAGTNVFVFFVAGVGNTKYAAQYTSVANDTPSTFATAVAAAITALDVPGVSASPVGNAVNVTGAAIVAVNVGGSAAAHKEVARVTRTVQVSIWVSSPWTRFQVHEAITTNLGTSDAFGIQLPDGGWIVVKPKGEVMDDKSQESTNLWVAHLTYNVEYGVVQRGTATQIGEINLQTIIDNESGQQIREVTSLIS